MFMYCELRTKCVISIAINVIWKRRVFAVISPHFTNTTVATRLVFRAFEHLCVACYTTTVRNCIDKYIEKMSVGKIGKFEVGNGTWSSYVDRLDMYFLVNDIKDELKLPTLIAVVGDEAYELLVNLASPRKPKDLTYAVAVELLRHHLQPTPSALAERYRFRQRRQVNNENVATYVAELKRLSRHCNFEASLNDNLRDQFICGLSSDIIRQKLFAEKDSITYSEAVKLALSLEAAERDSAAVEAKTTVSGGGDAQALHVMSRSGGSAGAGAGGGGRPPGAHAAWQSSTRYRGSNRNQRIGSAQNGTGGHQYCGGCGSMDHGYANCKFRDYICSRCQRAGHLRRVCPERRAEGAVSGNSRGQTRSHGRMYFGDVSGDKETEIEEDFQHLCLNDYRAVSVPVTIDSKLINMEVDTGTAISCISKNTYQRFFLHLQMSKSNLMLNFYDGSKISPIGLIKPTVSYAGRSKQLELFIIEGGTTSLLGRQWLAELDIKIPSYMACHNISCDQSEVVKEIYNLRCRYKELFSGGLGRFTGGAATLRVRAGATPVFQRARPVPYALRERIDEELDKMLKDGVIEPVDASDWASPLVPASKTDGSLRLCADYKGTLNPVLEVDRYPLPKIDDLMVNMSGTRYFSKIDLSQAYNQIELDDSKNIRS